MGDCKHKMRLTKVHHQRFIFTPGIGRVVYTFTCEKCGDRFLVRKHDIHPGHGMIAMPVKMRGGAWPLQR